jgi:DNA-binding transcriptional regulator LsrR (DeoR family)
VDAIGSLPPAEVVQLVGGVRSTALDRNGIELVRRLALVGVGSWRPPGSSLYDELAPAERTELLQAGATADVCALVLGAQGQPVPSPVLHRTIGISAQQLRRVPQVIALGGGQHKTGAITAALRSGLVDTLVTDSGTAHRLLDKAAWPAEGDASRA